MRLPAGNMDMHGRLPGRPTDQRLRVLIGPELHLRRLPMLLHGRHLALLTARCRVLEFCER